MIIKNISKKTIIADKASIRKSLLGRTMGLMFSPSPKKSIILQFRRESIQPLHMWFVFYPIDAIFLGKEKKVTETKENFMPFSFYTPKKKAMYIIETSKGYIKKSITKVGDKIEF